MSEEPHVIAALADLCKKMEIRCLVQVGAADADEAGRIHKETGCRAIGIEARDDAQCLSGNVEYHHAIIGATDGVTEFYLHPTSELSGHFKRGDEEKRVMMQQWRLDTFCFNNRLEPDALVIDTEGSTLDVLEGAGRILDNVRMIYAECQTEVLRPGIRLVGEVDTFLATRGFTAHQGLPSYACGGQGNYTWVKK